MIDRVEVAPGPGTVIRFGSIVAWAGASASAALISFLAQSARNLGPSEHGGEHMAEHIAGVLEMRDPEPHVAFAVIGPSDGGWAALLHGPVQLWDGERWLVAEPRPGWMRCRVNPQPSVSVNAAGSRVSPLSPDSMCDLEGGVVPGAGFILVPANRGAGTAFPPEPLSEQTTVLETPSATTVLPVVHPDDAGDLSLAELAQPGYSHQVEVEPGGGAGGAEEAEAARYEEGVGAEWGEDDLIDEQPEPASVEGEAIDEPVVDEPVVDEPVVDEPVVDEAVVDEPADVVAEPAAARAERPRKGGAPPEPEAQPEPDPEPPPPGPHGSLNLQWAARSRAARIPLPALPIGIGPDRTTPGAAVVAGILCPRGHMNRPGLHRCVRCSAPIPAETAYSVSGTRPPLGCLIVDNGSVYRLDRGYLVGSRPERDPTVRGNLALPLTLRGEDVSASHAEIRLHDWDVVLVDRASASGTYVYEPGASQWSRLTPYDPKVLAPGTHVAFGQRIVTFVTPWIIRDDLMVQEMSDTNLGQ